MSLRWNGSVLGRLNSPSLGAARGIFSSVSQSEFRRANSWPASNIFSPPLLDNLILHLDASVAESVTLNGTSVSSIIDLSSNKRDVFQSIAARQPDYIINERNSRNVVRFTAAQQMLLTLGSIAIPSSFTAFSVFGRPTSGTQSFFLGSETGNFYSTLWWTDNRAYQKSNANNTVHGSANTSTGWFYMTTRRNETAQIRIRTNGSTLDDISSGAGVSNPADGVWSAIGRRGADYTGGDMGEILLYNTSLSDSDVNSIEAYLAAKWAI